MTGLQPSFLFLRRFDLTMCNYFLDILFTFPVCVNYFSSLIGAKLVMLLIVLFFIKLQIEFGFHLLS